jgi:translation initiation factor 1A
VTLEKSRDVPFRVPGEQSYAVVTKMLGNRRLSARCEDRVERLCKIRGSMKRSEWISVGDLVLVDLRDYQDSKADVCHKYPEEDARYLRRCGELEAFSDSQKVTETSLEEMIVFEENDDDFCLVIDAL